MSRGEPDWARDDLTSGDLYRPAMEMQTEQEAKAYFEKLVAWIVKTYGKSEEETRRIQLANLGYFAGYYDSETMERVNRLFNTTHPVFGDTPPATPEEAFAMGYKTGSKS